MQTTSTMRDRVDDYLRFRRALGVVLRTEGETLIQFASFADGTGHVGPITTDIAVRWATLPRHAQRSYWAQRLAAVRRLARYMAPLESATQIPPEGLLGPSLRRKEPHIYSDEELVALLHAAMALSPLEGLRRHTYATLFGLLASTGLRISEALHLTHPEVDLTKGILLVSKGKFRQERLVPLHITTTQAMREYAQHRDHYHRNPASLTFFLSERGTPVKYITACSTFAKLRRRLGWRSGPSGRPPRIHDLRHTFAVRRLLQWYQEGADVDCNIAALSTYLGHVKVSSTYWYLTAVPELLAVAAARFEHFARDEQGGIR